MVWYFNPTKGFHVKQERPVLTAFGQYLWDNRISNAKFAVTMTKYLKEKGLLAEDEKFSPRTVEKWRYYGNRVPNSINMRAIMELTGLSPATFFDDPGGKTSAEDDRSG